MGRGRGIEKPQQTPCWAKAWYRAWSQDLRWPELKARVVRRTDYAIQGPLGSFLTPNLLLPGVSFPSRWNCLSSIGLGSKTLDLSFDTSIHQLNSGSAIFRAVLSLPISLWLPLSSDHHHLCLCYCSDSGTSLLFSQFCTVFAQQIITLKHGRNPAVASYHS